MSNLLFRIMKYNLANSIEKHKAITRFQKLLEDNKKIELKEVKPRRTLSQNAYLHVCITLYAIEFGFTVEEAKTQLKRLCDFMRYEKEDNNGKKIVFLKQTSIMTTDEIGQFIDWIRTHSAKHGCYIPTAEQYKENAFEIDKNIEQYKEHLS